MVVAFAITCPIMLSLNVGVRSYKFVKGRSQKKFIKQILVGNEEKDISSISYGVVAAFTAQVKTKHHLSGSRIKDSFRDMKRHCVVLQLDNGQHMMLLFRKKFWDDKEELQDPQFIVENLRLLDVRFHSHDGSSPLYVETCSMNFQFEGCKLAFSVKPHIRSESSWIHRKKEWLFKV